MLYLEPHSATASCRETTAQQLSFEWSQKRVSPTNFKVRTTLFSVTNTINSPLQKREGTGASFLYWLDWKSKH